MRGDVKLVFKNKRQKTDRINNKSSVVLYSSHSFRRNLYFSIKCLLISGTHTEWVFGVHTP